MSTREYNDPSNSSSVYAHNPTHSATSVSDPWVVDVTGRGNPRCDCPPPPNKTPKPQCTRSKPKKEKKDSDCCEQIIELLTSKEKTGSRKKLRKPKISSKIKLANWCCDWPVRDAIAPIMVLLFLRAQKKLSPKNEFEEAMYKFLDSFEPSQRAAFQVAVDAYLAIPDARRCGLETRFDDWPDERALEPEFLNKVISQEIISFGRYGVFGKNDGAASVGEMRMWEQPVPSPGEFKSKMVSGPWPWICSVNPGADNKMWFRNRDIVFPDKSNIDTINFEPHEFSMLCTPIIDPANPTHINVDCKDKVPSSPAGSFSDCDGGNKYNYHKPNSSEIRCLSIPKCVAGQGIALRGFNFTSLDCTVVIKKEGGGFPDMIAVCDVMGDEDPPTKSASCDIRDTITFTLPKSIRDGKNDRIVPPGRYTIEVHVPNETNFAPEPGPAPAEFVSNVAKIDVIPVLDISFQVWVERGNCYEETSGEWGDDEPWFRSYTASYREIGNQSFDIKSQDIFRHEDVESGDWIGFPPVTPFSGKFDIGGVAAIAIRGLEVDSDAAADQDITEFGKAYELYFKELLTTISVGAAGGPAGYGLGVLIDTGVVTASLVVGGIALGVVAIAGIFYAGWAPADPIGYDLLVVDPVNLFLLTTPGGTLPLQDAGNIGGITYSTYPKGFEITSGTTTVYREERQYRSDDEESRYGLDFKFNQL